MIDLGCSFSVTDIEEFINDKNRIETPIELKFDMGWNDIDEVLIPEHIDGIEKRIKRDGIKVLSIHFPALLRINSPCGYKLWDRTLKLSEKIDTSNTVVHPPRLKKTEDKVKEQKNILDLFNEENEGKWSIETFPKGQRIFTVEDMIEKKIPMTVDLSHFTDIGIIHMMIDKNLDFIKEFHFSSRSPSKHSPIDKDCFDILDILIKKKWNGIIILEYRQEYVEKQTEDYFVLKKYYENFGK